MILDQLAGLAVPVDSLTTLPGNPRRGDVGAVAKSLAKFGQRKPIVVDGSGTIIAGNHTYAAAVELGWAEIAVVRVNDDDVTAKAFALADNRTGDLGTYDDDLLLDALYEVRDYADLLDAAGYTAEDIDALLPPGPADGSLDDGDLPEPGGTGYQEQYGVIIVCDDEAHQRDVYEALVGSYEHVRVVAT